MAKPITPYVISAPGFYGLNTQDSPVDLSHNFALVAYNCVIDKFGRVGARKGWLPQHTTNADLGTDPIQCLGELVTNDGTLYTLAAGGGYLFKHSGTTLTTLTYGGGGAAPTITTDNWQFTQLNGIGIFFQIGYDPLIFDPAVSTTTFRRMSEKAGYTGTIPLANAGISAYGRIWCANTTTNKNTVTWSEVITPHLWTAGTAGSLNLLGVWPNGGDEIVALAAHNNFLIIFGKRQTLIYSGANTPSTMTLYDAIGNMGCVARDSIQNTGEDVIFLSTVGVMAISRVIQEKSSPLNQVSKNVRNDLQTHIERETVANIKSGYSPVEAFYLLVLPVTGITYCFDTRFPLEDGSLRTTTWATITPSALLYLSSRVLYLGKAGYIGKYTGYLDNTANYRMMYYTSWMDFGDKVLTSILKKVKTTIIGALDQSVVVKYAFDFSTDYRAVTTSVVNTTTNVSKYNVAKYNVGNYSQNILTSIVPANVGGAGKVAQIGIEFFITGNQSSIQQLEVFTKNGRY